MNTAVEICNLSQSRLSNRANVNDIDDPSNDAERAYAKWYDICRQDLLKMLMPNFALKRDIVSQDSSTPEFGYSYQYQRPADCLKVLGIGEVQEKENDYSVEGQVIMTDEDYEDGMNIRYVADITDVTKFSPEFVMLLSWKLAHCVCMEVTKDKDMLKFIESKMPIELSASSSVNAQENKPVRISNSLFKQAKTTDNPVNYNKK